MISQFRLNRYRSKNKANDYKSDLEAYLGEIDSCNTKETEPPPYQSPFNCKDMFIDLLGRFVKSGSPGECFENWMKNEPG